MKTTRWILGAALLGSLLSLQGCGAGGQYQIPNVEPVVKPKPEDDLLDDIEGNDKATDAKPTEAAKPTEPAKAPAESKALEAKPEAAPKAVEPAKPSEAAAPKAATPAKTATPAPKATKAAAATAPKK
jgi:hypothetical protein